MIPTRFDPPVYSVQLVCLDLINCSRRAVVADDGQRSGVRRVAIRYERRDSEPNKKPSSIRSSSLTINVGGGKNLFVTEEVKGLRLAVDEAAPERLLSTGYLDLDELRTNYRTPPVPTIREVELRVDGNSAASHVVKILVSMVEVGPLLAVKEDAHQQTASTQTDGVRPSSKGKNIGIQASAEVVEMREAFVQYDLHSVERDATAIADADLVGERRVYTLVLAFIIRRFCAKLLAARRERRSWLISKVK
jgi:hypothetical protein